MSVGQKKERIIDFGEGRLFRCRGEYFNLCDQCKLKYVCLVNNDYFIKIESVSREATKKDLMEFLFENLEKDGGYWFPKKAKKQE